MNWKGASTRRNVLSVIALLAVLSLSFQSQAAYTPPEWRLLGIWNRLNPNIGGPSPEHEVLNCWAVAPIRCLYDKKAAPLLGFQNPPDTTWGTFRGHNTTATWACPAWFPAEVCAGKRFVASGVMTYHQSSGTLLVANHDLVVTNVNGQMRLYLYWPDNGFACPWFRTWAAALAANPFPLPFNGVDFPANDCLVAP